MNICILYGTETGNAEMLAEDIQTALEDHHDVVCRNLADTEPSELNDDVFYVIVCSTYGEGELPASARPFAEKLEMSEIDLSHMRFSIFGLGDSEYMETFAHGSLRLSEKLKARGALQVGPRLTHNASGVEPPEDLALSWIERVLAELQQRVAQ